MGRRILLLKPSRLRAYQSSLVPPMGLLSLAAVLRRSGHQVRILDLRLYQHPGPAIDSMLREFRPEAIGISLLTFELEAARKKIQRIRSIAPGVPVVVGGPQATAMPRETLDRSGADAVVVGEGEDVVTPLMEALADRADPPDLPGVLVRGREDRDPGRAPMPDLATLPIPAWDLVDLEDYARRKSMSIPSPWRYATILTTRGCPWRCSYCHEIHGKRLRRRPLESVQAELEVIQHQLGEGVLEVLDDNFNVDQAWASQVLETLLRMGGYLRPAFPNGVRSDRLGRDLIGLMARVRTAFMSFAIESGDPEMQRRIRKNLDLDAAREAIEEAVRRGIFSNGFFMMGFPGERLDQMWRTVDFACRSPLHSALFFRVVAMPGTELWEEVHGQRHIALEQVQEDYFLNPVNLSEVPDVVMKSLYRLAWIRFYGDVGRAAMLYKVFPSKLDLARRSRDLMMLLVGWAPEAPQE
ncbi:MAG TPA: radical SAM protein [Myxococcota bacterium]|nr:radical SAM protein [Myxococcota bacterium]HQK52088.1 radical SAM protein [Myxococcota bacterium]